MHSLLLGFTLFLLVLSEKIDNKDCEKKGFASTLLCSSCDKLASFVGDSEIIEECQLCCLSDESDESKKVKQVTLLVHPFLETRLPEIRDFIRKHKNRYTNLVINTRANTPSARLHVVYDNGKSEIVNLDNWKSDQIRDFCDSVLVKVD
ncbi:putative selenoprotein [Blastocystis sp. subtype 4]|uniref:putative selenoprotein n=1 Tax=Blastocystis sp. subtype 4 TaxID=944170 RepID=UPI000711C69D|nr:putative selenoprotein [Blastocystis sp. subtype 4]KNB41622.1 putative selenoprotein [Blastocystis sp. subtype 4]|eukprot:XP_014525065.1 putative selenoprotein [Blastocystis sp. subtype 4]